MFSSELNGYNRHEVDDYISRMRDAHEKALMDERLKVLDSERKLLELKNRTKDIEEREKNIRLMLASFKKLQAEGTSNIELLRGEQLRLIYLQLQDFMKELNGRYPGVLVNSGYKRLLGDIQSVLKKVSTKKEFASIENDPMRVLLNKMQEKRDLGNLKEIKIERNPEYKERPTYIRPVTEMELAEGDGYDSLVDKFLASKPIEKQPKSMPITSNGFDLKAAVTPTDDLSEIMKAFDFFGADDQE